ncbi:MAG: UDP-N-acetyl-D-glucosamine dehydrogenase [Chloroflexi bacterium]|nr:UDP-N-acetyl-D-glucosamine dehydrogenase [Chloroflexota bacterium]|tara:strand:- start:16834 stop:18129 length:1296 start_codon:yes stop_codon:yes gene_type:complete
MNGLAKKLTDKTASVSVIGLGYIGLPLSISFAKAGFNVFGIDIDNSKIQSLHEQNSYISDVSDKELKNTIKNYKITFTSTYSPIIKSDVVIICVPTPLNKTKDPDISYIVKVSEEISKFDINKKLICLESTVYPGATEEVILPILTNNNNLKIGDDFNLLFSPERMDPGQSNWNLSNTPKVIGGITSNCTELGRILYNSVSENIIKVSSTKAAEMTKLLENTFRAANIGLINEMALICKKLNLDIWEIIEAAKTKPYGYMPFYPGPGLGGHCIPVDPRYLEWKLEMLNTESKFIKLSEDINFGMPDYVVQSAEEIIKKHNLSNKINIIGVTYKPNVSDIRESPAIDIMQILSEKNIKFAFNDPYINKVEIENLTIRSESIESFFNNKELSIIITDHANYDWNYISDNLEVIYDTRNALRNIKNTKINIYKL